MGSWFNRFTKFDDIYSLGEWVWAFCKFVGVPAMMLAALAGFSQWYWDTYGLAGVAFAFLVSALVLPLAGILLANAALYAARAKSSWAGRDTSISLDVSEEATQDEAKELIELRFKQAAELATTVNNAAIESRNILERRIAALGNALEKSDGRLLKIENTLRPPSTSYGLLSLLGQDKAPPENALEALGRKLDANNRSLGIQLESANNAIHALRSDLSGVANNLLRLQQDAHDTFRACATERDLDRCLENLRPITKELFAPSLKPDQNVDWGKWDAGYSEWQSRLKAICQIVRPYIDVEEKIFKIDPNEYRPNKWRFDTKIFPNEEQIMDYKDFCLRKRNFEQEEDSMLSAVRVASRV